jgi:hypothetical protein
VQGVLMVVVKGERAKRRFASRNFISLQGLARQWRASQFGPSVSTKIIPRDRRNEVDLTSHFFADKHSFLKPYDRVPCLSQALSDRCFCTASRFSPTAIV